MHERFLQSMKPGVPSTGYLPESQAANDFTEDPQFLKHRKYNPFSL